MMTKFHFWVNCILIDSICPLCGPLRRDSYLRWSLWNGFVLQGLKGFHCRIVAGSLASPSLSDKLFVPHRQLHIKYLRHWVMVPRFGRGPRDRERKVEWKKKRQVKKKTLWFLRGLAYRNLAVLLLGKLQAGSERYRRTAGISRRRMERDGC